MHRILSVINITKSPSCPLLTNAACTCTRVSTSLCKRCQQDRTSIYTSSLSNPKNCVCKTYKTRLDRAQIYNFRRPAIRLHFPLQELRMWTEANYRTLHQAKHRIEASQLHVLPAVFKNCVCELNESSNSSPKQASDPELSIYEQFRLHQRQVCQYVLSRIAISLIH